MDAIVPPGNTSLVTSDHIRRDNCGPFVDLADRISTAAETVMANDNANAHHASSVAERIGLAGIGSTERNGAEGRGNTDRNGLEGRQLTREEGHESRSEVRRNADAIERFGLKNLEATKDSLKDLLISTKDDLKNVLISQKDDIKDLLISNKNDFKELALKNCQVEKDLLLQFKDAQLVAMQNKADLQRQIAECCCENKALIIEQGNSTRDLIRAENEARLREKITHLEQQLLRSTIPPFPVAAIA